MTKFKWVMTLLLSFSLAIAEEEAEKTDTDNVSEEEPQALADTGPKKMSGISILGNEEPPKSLVIVRRK